MIGYKLTPEQKDQVQGKHVTPYSFINCVQDANGVWFFLASLQDRELYEGSEYMWLFDLPQEEYVAPPSRSVTF